MDINTWEKDQDDKQHERPELDGAHLERKFKNRDLVRRDILVSFRLLAK